METLLGSEHILQFLLAVGLGCFLGIRRELDQVKRKYRSYMGVRTMTILSGFGAISTFFPEQSYLPVVFFGMVGVMVAIAYAYDSFKAKHIGMTAELTALMVFWIGVFAGMGESILAILLTIFLGIMNEFRDNIHAFVKTLTGEEVRGALQLLILSGAVLPFLPREAVDPWGVIVPFEIWLLVILISGIGFLGYFFTKYFSKKSGILVSAFLGSMASSTAVTASLAEQSKRISRVKLFAAGILLALATMQIRVLLEIVLVGGEAFRDSFLWVPIAMAGASLLACLYVLRTKDTSAKPSQDFPLTSPFEVMPALKFGALFVIVLVVLKFADDYFGEAGVYIASALSGIVDVDAIVLSSLESTKMGEITENTGKTAILIALIVNTIVKLGYVWFLGSRALLKKICWGTIFISVVGGITFYLV